ncbi:MAG: hypothetical protein GWO28_01215 [candidate division Zixibacteria bacterium]|nr:hypothetical protein [candidate division Zixibacteria bacterium]
MIKIQQCKDDKSRILILGGEQRPLCTNGKKYIRRHSVTHEAMPIVSGKFRYVLGQVAAEFTLDFQPTCCGMYHMYDLKLVGAPSLVKDEKVVATLVASLHNFIMDDMSRNTIHTAIETNSLLEKYLIENGWEPVGPSVLDKETNRNMQVLFGHRSKLIGRDVRLTQ